MKFPPLPHIVGFFLKTLVLIFMSTNFGHTEEAPPSRLPGCTPFLDSLHAEYHSGDPTFLLRDVASATCNETQKQDAYYHQALGLMILGKSKDALLYLKAALDYPGPFREQAWFELWRVAQQTEDEAVASQAMMRLYDEFPNSPHFFEILAAETQASHAEHKAKNARPKPFAFETLHLISSTHEPGYARDYLENRFQVSKGFQWGDHHFSPGIQTSMVHDFNGWTGTQQTKSMELSTLSGELSLGYLHRWLFGTFSSGFRYDFMRDEYANLSSSGLLDQFTGWNYPQLGASLGCRIPTSSDLVMTAFGTANRFNESFQSISLNGSGTIEKGAFTHQLNLSLERMFLNTPSIQLPDTLHFEPIPGSTSTDITHMEGLWSDEVAYSLEYHQPKWSGTWTTTFREERRVLSNGEDSVYVVANNNPGFQYGYPGDRPSTERQASTSAEIHWKMAPWLQWKTLVRLGYFWVTPSYVDQTQSDWALRMATSLTTHF